MLFINPARANTLDAWLTTPEPEMDDASNPPRSVSP
jgi:hypothetical protein